MDDPIDLSTSDVRENLPWSPAGDILASFDLTGTLTWDYNDLINTTFSPSACSDSYRPEDISSEVDDNNLFCHSVEHFLMTPDVQPSTSPSGCLFPEGHQYYIHKFNHNSCGLFNILPVPKILEVEKIDAYAYNASLALAALDCFKRTRNTGQGAFSGTQAQHHCVEILQGVRTMLKNSNPSKENQSHNPSYHLSWLLCILLLGNYDLQNGSISKWRYYLRMAGTYLSLWYQEIHNSNSGKLVIQAFARMMLLYKMSTGDCSITSSNDINPGLVVTLADMLASSTSPRDRLLPIIDRVGTLELKYRQSPQLEAKWKRKALKILQELKLWQESLPAEELPVDSGIEVPINYSDLSSEWSDTMTPYALLPLCFPKSVDACTSAVNYAHFLCARMRVRTRYLLVVGRELPKDTEVTSMTICRIAAGVSPDLCGQQYAYDHGMMPAVMGAYRWTSDIRLRQWIHGWLGQYTDTREGIWSIEKTRRLTVFLDAEYEKRGGLTQWEIVAVKIIDCEGEGGLEREETEDINRAFKVMVHSRSRKGWSTEILTVPPMTTYLLRSRFIEYPAALEGPQSY